MFYTYDFHGVLIYAFKQSTRHITVRIYFSYFQNLQSYL